jgi:small subunit ribosomal protein S8
MVGKNQITVPSSKLKVVVAKELQKAGYLTDVKVESAKPRDILVVTINKEGENSTINELKRLSKPGRRMYTSAADMPKVKSGRGIVLVSTSKGVITGAEAVKQKLGGELLLSVY